MTTVPSITELFESSAPFVLADDQGLVTAINRPFTEVYGWELQDLEGRPVTAILPESFRMSHQLGFSRFQSTEESQVLGHPLRLRTVCRDGQEIISEHFIVGEKRLEGWVFGATLTPLPDETETDA